MRKKIQQLLILILVLSLFLLSPGEYNRQSNERKKFDTFLSDLFVHEVQTDSLSQNYYLADPLKFGINNKEITLGEFGIDKMNEELIDTENYLKSLQNYHYSLLTPDQQLTYDILQNMFQQGIHIYGFKYYNELLGPTTGLQAELPIMLAEFNFLTKEDIDEYIKLLPCVYDYFEDVVQFEREKSEQGLFMTDTVAQSIIDQCEVFVENPDENFLIEYFNEKVSTFNGLKMDEIKAYKEANKKAVLNYVIPAYKLLIDALKELMGTGRIDGGLYYYPEGRAYYECNAKFITGSDKSVQEMCSMLDTEIDKDYAFINTQLTSDNPIVDFNSFPITDPQEIITDLKEKTKTDFPEVRSVNINIKNVPASLSDYLSPAMYIAPPIDRYTENNNIYINVNDDLTLSIIYPIVAHESYPGHLYQYVYFRSKNPEPIRNIMSFTGYVEGWATYVEMLSYHFSGIEEHVADFLEAQRIFNICICARVDIGINYEGWRRDKVTDYLEKFYIDAETAGRIYENILAEPFIYLPYTIGYLEIMDLKEKAEDELGNKFVPKQFHQFLLDIGPAQFNIIEDHEEIWMEEIEGKNNTN